MRIKTQSLPVDLQLKLFDQTILPIMTYSCESFGYENCVVLKKFILSFFALSSKQEKALHSLWFTVN